MLLKLKSAGTCTAITLAAFFSIAAFAKSHVDCDQIKNDRGIKIVPSERGSKKRSVEKSETRSIDNNDDTDSRKSLTTWDL